MLLVFIGLAIVLMTMWYREGSTGIVHRVRGSVHAVAAPVSAAGEIVTRPVRSAFSWARDLGVSRTELARLRSENERLRARVGELEEARLENERLRGLVKLTQSRELKSIAARVIGRPTNSWEGVITIDRGTDDGVTAGMAVLGPRGLLGQTIEVTGSSARVRLITDQRSGVAALVQGTRATGVVKGSLEGALELDFISRETTVKPGDVIVSSGLGGVYPKGVIIGEVASVDRTGGALYQRIRVQPSGEVSGLEEVLVVLNASSTPTTTGGGE